MTEDLQQTVSAALRASSATTDDCPNLFLRVAAGVERRRRRHRTTAGAVVVVAVGVVLAVPALGRQGAGRTTISAEGATGEVVSTVVGCAVDSTLPSNSFVRRAEAIDGTTCTATELAPPTTIRWVQTARRYGLLQP
jgi:hypothetical protein